MYEIFAELLVQKGLKPADVTRATGIHSAVFSEWKKGKSRPNTEKLIKIANFLGVSVEYLVSGKIEDETENTILTTKDQRDIAKELESIMDKLDSGEDGPVRYNGQIIDDNSRILLRNALELGLTQLKVENKKLYNPNKNKK